MIDLDQNRNELNKDRFNKTLVKKGSQRNKDVRIRLIGKLPEIEIEAPHRQETNQDLQIQDTDKVIYRYQEGFTKKP